MGENGVSCAATLVERMPQHSLLVGLNGQNSDAVANALIGQANALPSVMQASLTWYKGSKMAQRAALTPANETQVCLAGPHSPWRRPSNKAR